MLDIVGQAKSQAEAETAAREQLHALEGQTSADLNANRTRIEALRQEVRRLAQQSTEVFREREAIGRELAVAQERLRWITEQAAALEAERASRSEAEAALEARLAAAREEAATRDLAVAQAEVELRSLRGETPLDKTAELEPAQARLRLDRLRSELGASEARLAQGLIALERARLDLATVDQRLERARTDATAQQARRTDLEARLAEASTSLANRRELQSSAQENLKAVGEAVEQQGVELSSLRARAAAGEARLQQASDATGVDVEAVLQQAVERGDLKAWSGRLSTGLHPSSETALAVRAALGFFAEGFGFESAQAVERAADHLGEGAEATAAIVALSGLRPTSRLPAPEGEGVLGNAADLARPSQEFRAAIETLLGNTWIVRDRKTARRLLPSLAPGVRLVTLSGDVFHADGHVVLNAARPFRGRKEIAERLTKDLDSVRLQLEQGETELRRLNHRMDNARTEVNLADDLVLRSTAEEHRLRAEVNEALAQEKLLQGEVAFADERRQALEAQLREGEEGSAAEEAARARLAEEQARLERVVRLDEVQHGGEAAAAHLAHAESTLQMAGVARSEAGDRLAEAEATWAAARREADQHAARLGALSAEQTSLAGRVADGERRAAEVEERLASLQALAGPAEDGLRQAEEERSALERLESEHRAEVQQAERKHSQAQIELARRQEEQASLRRRVEDDFGLVAFDFDETSESQVPIPFEGLVEHMARVDELPIDFEATVSRLRLQLRRMGAINPEAQKEYLEVKERVEFLTAQVEDLEQAEGQLQGVIAELDVQMETEFQKTFEAVAREFREAFTRLFGGGSVRLSLTDPDDLSQTGIDIEARLPGRREQGLAMLSGGERSLTACALVFALLKVSPTPFCVLDEVDAMLDESNVARFREMLRELSGQTQFVVITHNRQTVQAAEVLYGVSMGPDSSSRVISLKLDEAARELEEQEAGGASRP
jgi:chromosome segregation protein